MNEPTTDVSFYHAYGLSIARWNALEGAFKALLRNCSGGGPAVEILVEQMTNREISNALHSMILRHERSHLAPAVNHAVNYFLRLEIYRNYYVHEVLHSRIIDPDTGQYAPFSWSSRLDQKGNGVKNRRAVVKLGDIEIFDSHCTAAGKFISELIRHLLKMPEEWQNTPLEPFPNLPTDFKLPYSS